MEFTRTQELIYELPIERVMKKEVISVSPQTSILELKEVLRLNRISGVPVLEGRQLVGVISIADLIKSLERGELQARVGEKMTQGPITVKEKESVVEAVKKFARHKVGRLLVIDEQGELKGILTCRGYYPGIVTIHQPGYGGRGDQTIPGPAAFWRYRLGPDQPDPALPGDPPGF